MGLMWRCWCGQVLGVPKESTWPGVSHMPSYKHISGWGAGYPSESILRKVRHWRHSAVGAVVPRPWPDLGLTSRCACLIA